MGLPAVMAVICAAQEDMEHVAVVAIAATVCLLLLTGGGST